LLKIKFLLIKIVKKEIKTQQNMDIETNNPNSSIWDPINNGNNSSFWMTYNEL